jgi:hypothetical protein
MSCVSYLHPAVRFERQLRLCRAAELPRPRRGARLPQCVDGRAAARHDRWIAASLDDLFGYFGLSGPASVAVAGTPDDRVRGVREVIDAGAELILFSPIFGEAGRMERLAAEVIPRLS